MKRVSQEEAHAILAPHEAVIHRCLHEAWAKYEKVIAPLMPSALPRDRRNAMSGLVDQEVRSQLGARGGVRIRVANARVLAYIDEKLILYTKFFASGTLETRNNSTPTSEAFDRGRPLPFLEDFARVCVGYRHDRLETGLLGVYVKEAWPFGWAYEILGEAESAREGGASSGAVILPFRPKVQPLETTFRAKVGEEEGDSEDTEAEE